LKVQLKQRKITPIRGVARAERRQKAAEAAAYTEARHLHALMAETGEAGSSARDTPALVPVGAPAPAGGAGDGAGDGDSAADADADADADAEEVMAALTSAAAAMALASSGKLVGGAVEEAVGLGQGGTDV